MQLDGIHHITAITADAQRNVDFYAGVLGLRFIKKTVNFDAPQAYHLYYGDDPGNPGTILTFFEYRGVEQGRAGAGMIDTIAWRVPAGSLGYWRDRLTAEGFETDDADAGTLVSADPEGLRIEIVGDAAPEEGLTSTYSDVPPEHALRGFNHVRALVADPRSTEQLMNEIGFERPGEPYAFSLAERSLYRLRVSSQVGIQGAGTVHHIAWACEPDEQEAWRNKVADVGMQVTPIIDRQYFRSIYFREPGGVLFEIATKGPGFTVDEAQDELGTGLKLPPQHEPLRPILERELTPITIPDRRVTS